MSSVGFETAFPAVECQQNYALDFTATGIGSRSTHFMQLRFDHYYNVKAGDVT